MADKSYDPHLTEAKTWRRQGTTPKLQCLKCPCMIPTLDSVGHSASAWVGDSEIEWATQLSPWMNSCLFGLPNISVFF